MRTVDTDIVTLSSMKLTLRKWIAFGTGTNFRYILIHEVVVSMDPRVCATLPMFHAFTGYNTACLNLLWKEQEHMEGLSQSYPGF